MELMQRSCQKFHRQDAVAFLQGGAHNLFDYKQIGVPRDVSDKSPIAMRFEQDIADYYCCCLYRILNRFIFLYSEEG